MLLCSLLGVRPATVPSLHLAPQLSWHALLYPGSRVGVLGWGGGGALGRSFDGGHVFERFDFRSQLNPDRCSPSPFIKNRKDMPTRRVRSAARLHGGADSPLTGNAMRPSASTPGLGMRPTTAPDLVGRGGMAASLDDGGGASGLGGLSTSASAKSLLKKGEIVHTRPWEPTKLYRVHTPDADASLKKLLQANQGAKPGRLTSEDYGIGYGKDFGPAVRRKNTPGLKPRHSWQIMDQQAEAEKRRRPRSSIEYTHRVPSPSLLPVPSPPLLPNRRPPAPRPLPLKRTSCGVRGAHGLLLEPAAMGLLLQWPRAVGVVCARYTYILLTSYLVLTVRGRLRHTGLATTGLATTHPSSSGPQTSACDRATRLAPAPAPSQSLASGRAFNG